MGFHQLVGLAVRREDHMNMHGGLANGDRILLPRRGAWTLRRMTLMVASSGLSRVARAKVAKVDMDVVGPNEGATVQGGRLAQGVIIFSPSKRSKWHFGEMKGLTS